MKRFVGLILSCLLALTPAQAGFILNPFAFSSAPPAFTLTYIGSDQNLFNNNAVQDHGSFSIPRDGLMIVAGADRSAGATTVSSVSIGGTNGNIHVQNASSTRQAYVASRAVSAGSQNVTVTYSAANDHRSAVFVWLLEGYNSATPTDTAVSESGSGSTSIGLDISAGGIAVYADYHFDNADTSWSSATERDELSDGGQRLIGADKSTVSALTPHNETASWSGSNVSVLAGASWR